MLFPLTICAFFGAAVLWALCWKRTAVTMFLLATTSMIGVGSGPLTKVLLDNLQDGYQDSRVPAAWPQRSVIVLLGMGTVNVPPNEVEVGPLSFGRIATAADAYLSCRRGGGQCTVLVTGGAKHARDAAEADVYARQLVRLGVAERDLVLEGSSDSTWENAKFSSPLLKRLEPQKTYLVTSGVHMRRALIYFRHFGVEAVPIRSDYLQPWNTVVPMAYNFALADLAMSEYRGMLRYRFYNAMGWNN